MRLGRQRRAVNLVDALHHARHDVRNLRQGKLLTDADSRTTIEREVVPPGPTLLPPLRAELVSIGPPEVGAVVHNVDRVADILTLLHKDGRLPVGTTTDGENRVDNGAASVHGDNGIQAERLVDAPLQVLQVLEPLKRDGLGAAVRAELVENHLAQASVDVRVPGLRQRVEEPAQGGRRGVATGEQDVEQLRAQLHRIRRLLGNRLEEDVPLLLLFDLLLAPLLLVVDGLLHKIVDKLVADAHVVVKLLGVAHPVVGAQTAGLGELVLRLVKRRRKRRRARFRGAVPVVLARLAVDALAKQKLGRRIEGEAEEERLQVHHPRPSAALVDLCVQHRHQVLDVGFFERNVADLASDKLRTEHSA